jgi:hypothetical protein
MAALEAAHAALALRLPTVLSPRMSSGDPRRRHLGLSHHTRSVLELLLGRVQIPLPESLRELWPEGAAEGADETVAELERRHDPIEEMADLDGYAASGLPARTMGRTLREDELFFAAALAAGEGLHRQVS